MSTCCCALIFKGKKSKKRDHNGSTDSIVRQGSFSGSQHSDLNNDRHGRKKSKLVKPTEDRVQRVDEELCHRTRPSPSLHESEQSKSSSNNGVIDLSTDFRVQVLGLLENVQGLDHSQEDHMDLINTLDRAKMNGQLSLSTQEEDFVILTLSKYGLKVTELYPPSPKVVRKRYPLTDIIRIVNFEDPLNQSLLAVKIGRVGDDVYDCLIFQCPNQEQAIEICKTLTKIFDAICEIEVLESDLSEKYKTL
ncbi:integrin beta-1-binding protein 1-like [Saccoglossus kowalevskii]|uniref:Integrin beta-1-binding protein 1-like n=1 Tax=Saccoglossus kowalevskii TaxID=10224 RepID=A0ABM0GSY9_SACKO|nr:PREDICTED: integrin beta-1-binding protein 1-like [Saccoglossus kowalevskii]